MEPITTGLLIGSIASPLIGGVLGNVMSAGDRNKAETLINEAYSDPAFSAAPPDQQAAVLLQKFEQQGIYTPELEQALPQITSSFERIKKDPTGREAQLLALGQLKQASAGGLRPEDREAINRLRKEAAIAEQAKLAQITQGMQQRGIAGSGQELAMQLQGAQGAAEQSAAAGDRIAALSSQAAREALSQMANLGGTLRQQDYGEEAEKARAQDVISQFNQQAALQRQQRNIEALNRAQLQNLSEKQRIADANAQMLNREKYRQLEAQRQLWQDKIAAAQQRAQGATAKANLALGQAAQAQQMWQGMGQGVGQGLGAASTYMAGAKGRDAAAAKDQAQTEYYKSRTPSAGRLEAPDAYTPQTIKLKEGDEQDLTSSEF